MYVYMRVYVFAPAVPMAKYIWAHNSLAALLKSKNKFVKRGNIARRWTRESERVVCARLLARSGCAWWVV